MRKITLIALLALTLTACTQAPGEWLALVIP